MTITDRELAALLEAIKNLALLPYPFAEGVTRNPVLLMALGEIAGVAMKALNDYRANS